MTFYKGESEAQAYERRRQLGRLPIDAALDAELARIEGIAAERDQWGGYPRHTALGVWLLTATPIREYFNFQNDPYEPVIERTGRPPREGDLILGGIYNINNQRLWYLNPEDLARLPLAAAEAAWNPLVSRLSDLAGIVGQIVRRVAPVDQRLFSADDWVLSDETATVHGGVPVRIRALNVADRSHLFRGPYCPELCRHCAAEHWPPHTVRLHEAVVAAARAAGMEGEAPPAYPGPEETLSLEAVVRAYAETGYRPGNGGTAKGEVTPDVVLVLARGPWPGGYSQANALGRALRIQDMAAQAFIHGLHAPADAHRKDPAWRKRGRTFWMGHEVGQAWRDGSLARRIAELVDAGVGSGA